MKKKALSLFLAMAMLLTMIPAGSAPLFAETGTGATFEMVPLGSDAYKLVFSAKTNDYVTFFNTIFSFDNTMIQPVNRATYAAVEPVHDVGTVPGYGIVFQVVAKDIYDITFSTVSEGWKINGTRTAFNYSVFTTDPTEQPMESNGEYKPVFEFYFRLKDGKTPADISADTFRFENGNNAGNFIVLYNPSADSAGILLNAIGADFWWGCNNQALWPDTIDEVINPFDVTPEPTYTASIDPFNSHTFHDAEAGYGALTVQAFTVTNTGTGTLTGLAAALNPGVSFEISSALSAATIAPGGTAAVYVRPITGLAVGTYTDTLRVTGDNGINISVSLSFTVTEHVHDWGDWAVTTPATCITPGVETKVCLDDASHTETRPIPATGHDWGDWFTTKPRNCIEQGEEKRICANDASHTQTRATPIDEASHVGGTYESEITAATETDDGVMGIYCNSCYKLISTRPIPATGHTHNWGDWTVTTPAACETAGEETRVCANDNSHTDTRAIPASGHAWGDWGVTTPATCIAAGVETRICANDPSHTDTQPTAIDPTNHVGDTYEREITAATESAEGVMGIYCDSCNNLISTRTIPVISHTHNYESVVTAATCEDPGYTTHTCSICSDTYTDSEVPALGHLWGAWDVTTAATCEADGEETRVCARDAGHVDTRPLAATGHDWGDWTVTTPAACETAGEETRVCANDASHVETRPIPGLIHNYVQIGHLDPTEEGDGYDEFECSLCGDTYRVAIPAGHYDHSYTDHVTAPTCTEQGYTTHVCDYCGANYTDTPTAALGHDFSVFVSQIDAGCVEDGATVYGCSRCDETETQVIQALGHAWDEGVVTEATCEGQGYTTITCMVCGDSYVEEGSVVETLGHDWVSVERQAATETENGFEVFVCNRCEETYTQVLSATGGGYYDYDNDPYFNGGVVAGTVINNTNTTTITTTTQTTQTQAPAQVQTPAPVDIADSQTALGAYPEVIVPEQQEYAIVDEETPLGNLPKTGTSVGFSGFGLMGMGLSGLLTLFVGRKKED